MAKRGTKEWKRKISMAHMGKKMSKEVLEKQRIRMLVNNPFKGKKHNLASREKIRLSRIGKSSWNKGKKRPPFSKEWRKKMSDTHKKIGTRPPIRKGNKHHNWKGGIGRLPYPFVFGKELKLRIRQRDNFICQLCGKTEKQELKEIKRALCVNHIDFNKDNCDPKNLNTLCCACNSTVNFDRKKWTKYFKSKK